MIVRRRSVWAVALTALSAVVLLSPAGPVTSARAQTTSRDIAGAATASVEPSASGAASKAVAKVKDAATRAADIFRRVPCLSPKGVAKTMRSLPHVARKLAEHRPVTIIAFGSSSTQGYGSTAPEFTYPNRLAAQLKRKYPTADITVLNRGRGGEDAPEMLARLKQAVIDEKPDLVIWQVGTNAILRNLDATATVAQVEEGISRIQAAGADVVLVDPQYVPAVNQKGESAGRMVRLLNKVAGQHHVGIFPRFAVMREWHEKQSLAFDRFSIADGLHMNDWGYACFAQLLGDDIIRSVGEAQAGVSVPSEVLTYQPM
ncbi:MAG: SGNH/GDSL hydrolase family protein [Xanthobacteraceae bacterium]|nr:SGNH/GDSL hydrolase family protein [Xanthobacteraceae bacterium]